MKYLELLVKWNRAQRLVSRSDPDWIAEHLLLDSLLFLRLLPSDTQTVADLGSGAGIPGVPIAIVRADARLTLIESRQKRVSFLSAVVRELPLSNVRVVGRRAEASPELVGSFDAVVARCAGRASDVLEVGLRLVRVGGFVVISGPPREDRLNVGSWVTIPGPGGRPRRFALATKP